MKSDFIVSTEGAMKKRYLVTLTFKERDELQSMVSKGTAAARKLARANPAVG